MISEDIRFPTRAGMNYIGETQVSKSAAWLPWLGGVISLLLLAVASFAIHHELKTYHYHDILRHLSEIPRPQLLLAVVLTAVNYLALTGYDTLAFRHIHRVLAYPKIALTSFISYVFSYNVGPSVFGGTAIRYRFYSSWGILLKTSRASRLFAHSPCGWASSLRQGSYSSSNHCNFIPVSFFLRAFVL